MHTLPDEEQQCQDLADTLIEISDGVHVFTEQEYTTDDVKQLLVHLFSNKLIEEQTGEKSELMGLWMLAACMKYSRRLTLTIRCSATASPKSTDIGLIVFSIRAITGGEVAWFELRRRRTNIESGRVANYPEGMIPVDAGLRYRVAQPGWTIKGSNIHHTAPSLTRVATITVPFGEGSVNIRPNGKDYKTFFYMRRFFDNERGIYFQRP